MLNIRNNQEMQTIYQQQLNQQNYYKQGTIPATDKQPAQQYQMNFRFLNLKIHNKFNNKQLQ